MIRWLLYIIIVVGIFLVPTEGTDVGKLQPVQTVAVYQVDDHYVIETDTRDVGQGTSLQKAIENLKETTPAVVYLDTADFLLVDGVVEHQLDELKGVLKGSVSVYRLSGTQDLKETSKFLSTKQKGPSLKSWKNGVILPVLTCKNGRMILA